MKNQFLVTALLLFLFASMKAAPFRYVVAQDGSGDYTSIQAAITACPDNKRRKRQQCGTTHTL
jgi:pectinesterase